MNEERKFLHDISSPLTTLQLSLANILTLIEEDPAGHRELLLEMLRKATEQTKRAGTMVQERRRTLTGDGK